jgi:hypothetical protein
MTERQRRALLKQHPEVVSWAEYFAAQRKHRGAGQRLTAAVRTRRRGRPTHPPLKSLPACGIAGSGAANVSTCPSRQP